MPRAWNPTVQKPLNLLYATYKPDTKIDTCNDFGMPIFFAIAIHLNHFFGGRFWARRSAIRPLAAVSSAKACGAFRSPLISHHPRQKPFTLHTAL